MIFLSFVGSTVLANTTKYSPIFDSDKSIERYRKLVRKVDGKVVKDDISYYYHKVISGGDAHFKLLEKLAKEKRIKGTANIKSGSEIVRVQIPKSEDHEIYQALNHGRGLLLPVFKPFFRRTSGINVVFNWSETQRLYAELRERLKLDLLPLELTKKWAEKLT